MGQLIVPFEGAYASSIEFGALAASNDVSQYSYVRGTVSSPKEAWATLAFNHRDLMEHDGRIPESTFLKILPSQVDQMMAYFKTVMSQHLLDGSRFATFTVDGTAGGVATVDFIDRFTLGQKVSIIDGNTSAASYYVIAINKDAKQVTVSATRGGSAADISAYTVAQNARFAHPGALSEPFTSLRDQLLSNANGGSASLFGQTKTAYPFLQALNRSGADITATNILDKIFDAYTERLMQARGGKTPEVIMNLKHLGSIMKLLEVQKGGFNVVPNSVKANVYGWTEIMIGSVMGHQLKLVGLQEMPLDIIYMLDWDGIKFYSNGLFRRRKSPNGNEYFEERATTGYRYLLDHCLFGDLVVTSPWKQLVIHSIPNY